MSDYRRRPVALRLNCHQLRALLCLISRVRLTPIERLDLQGVTPELERAIGVAATVVRVAPPKRRRKKAACHDTSTALRRVS